MVLGMTGYGKSFSVMQMVTNIMLRWPDDDIVLIDQNRSTRISLQPWVA